MNPNVVPGPNIGPTAGRGMIVGYWIKKHWKLLLVIIIGIAILAQTIFQIVYPSSRLAPGIKVDGVDVGGMKYADAAKKLDGLYGNLKLDIYYGKVDAPFWSPKMSEVGIGVNNEERLKNIEYPMHLRFIPGSIWWAPGLSKPGDIKYVYDKQKINSYTIAQVGESCTIKPTNATLELRDSQLQLVRSKAGGRCDINDFQEVLANVQPDSGKKNQVRIKTVDVPAAVTDDIARDLALKLNNRMLTPMPMAVDGSTASIPGRIVLGWLDFEPVVPEDSTYNNVNRLASLKFVVNTKRTEEYLNQGIAAKLIIKPGVSRVTTLDFTETSRVNGANGRAVDMERTVKSIEDYINNKNQQAVGATKVVGPSTVFTRNYSPTSVGFAALLAQYDDDDEGAVYAAAFTELSGLAYPRSAQYRANERMPAAGIHSLYIAYADVMDESAGNTRPIDKISGDTDAKECFQLMLQQFDENCRKGFYNKLGYAKITSYANGLGLANTMFNGEDTVTSANDLQKVMLGLYNNKVARQEGGARILSTINTGVRDKDGIPAGSGTNQNAHVIGQSDKVYNDTAIVYGSKYGVFALTIMSQGDGASWKKVADLTQKIMKLKAVPVPKDAR